MNEPTFERQLEKLVAHALPRARKRPEFYAEMTEVLARCLAQTIACMGNANPATIETIRHGVEGYIDEAMPACVETAKLLATFPAAGGQGNASHHDK